MTFLAALAGALIAGWLAEKKNRNILGWAMFGALAHIVAIIVLLFLPALCPFCSQPLTNRQVCRDGCPTCGHKAGDTDD